MVGRESFEAVGAFERKLRRFAPQPAEKALLSGFSSRKRKIEAGEELASAERPPELAFILHEGWACAYKLLADGTRQTIDFRLPGDMLCLVGVLIHKLDYNVVALTDLVVSEVSVGRLVSALGESSQLAQGVLWSVSRDLAIIGEHLVNVGRRDALARTAHLFIELGYRLNQVGLGRRDGYECPLTQKDLADALGMTHVHLNRVLRYLRDHELLSFNDHTVTLHDMAALTRIADFDKTYLEAR